MPMHTGTDAETRTLLAVVRAHAPGRPVMIPDVMAATGLSRVYTWKQLDRLRAAELVTWERGKTGTMRPLVAEIPIRRSTRP